MKPTSLLLTCLIALASPSFGLAAPKMTRHPQLSPATSPPAILTTNHTFTKITSGDIVTRLGRSQGAAWADFDSDGHLDIYVGRGAHGEATLYHNAGDGTFRRIVGVTGFAQGSSWADIDNDGHPDLFTGGFNIESVLYRNRTGGNFARTLFESGQGSIGLAWGDYDNDGHVDLFVSNGGAAQFASPRRDFLYRNNGNGRLVKTTVSQVGSLAATAAPGTGAAWADYDSDGDLDLFVATWGPANLLYRNSGLGTFEPVLEGDIVTRRANSWGCAWGDYDNDGHLDLFVANGSGQNNLLYRSNGDGSFTQITEGSLVNDGGESAACAWGDFDNDGWLDLYVSNGHSRGERNFLYRGNVDGTFTRITEGDLVNEVAFSWGCAWGDYNNDGFLDLFVANGSIATDQADSLFRNNGSHNAWLRVQCRGTRSNRSGIGVKVRIKATISDKTFWQLREINTGDGFSGNAQDPHFGLGDARQAETVRIEWPSGAIQELHNISANQVLTLTEPAYLEPHVNQANGLVGLKVKGWKNSMYDIEASSDLKTWTRLTTLADESGTLSFPDTEAENAKQRFYRIHPKPAGWSTP